MNIYNHEQKFNDSKYTKWYYGIIENALQRDPVINTDFYYEKHHILPKSLFSVHKNSKENLVYLTPKEHFICHLLLTKITSGKDRYKMSKALTMFMHVKNIGNRKLLSMNSRWYVYQRNLAHEVRKSYWTDEQRHLQSIRSTTYHNAVDKNSKEYNNRIEKLKIANKTKVWTDKAIQNRLANCLKNAELRRGKPWSEKRRSAYNPDLKQSDESNEKRSDALRGRKTSTGMLGKNHSDLTKLKMSKSQTGIAKPNAISGYWYISPTGDETLFCPIGITARQYNLGTENLRKLRLGLLKKNKHKGWTYLREATDHEVNIVRKKIATDGQPVQDA